MLHATDVSPRILKPSSKKQMDFKYVAYKFFSTKCRAVLQQDCAEETIQFVWWDKMIINW